RGGLAPTPDEPVRAPLPRRGALPAGVGGLALPAERAATPGRGAPQRPRARALAPLSHQRRRAVAPLRPRRPGGGTGGVALLHPLHAPPAPAPLHELRDAPRGVVCRQDRDAAPLRPAGAEVRRPPCAPRGRPGNRSP